MNKQRLLVEIDVLNDTRLGCIALHKPEAIITIMDNGYWDRISDDFESLSEGMVTNEEFAAWYKDRTWKALKQSTITNGVHVVGQMLLELQRKKLEGVTVGDIVLTVNM